MSELKVYERETISQTFEGNLKLVKWTSEFYHDETGAHEQFFGVIIGTHEEKCYDREHAFEMYQGLIDMYKSVNRVAKKRIEAEDKAARERQEIERKLDALKDTLDAYERDKRNWKQA